MDLFFFCWSAWPGLTLQCISYYNVCKMCYLKLDILMAMERMDEIHGTVAQENLNNDYSVM